MDDAPVKKKPRKKVEVTCPATLSFSETLKTWPGVEAALLEEVQAAFQAGASGLKTLGIKQTDQNRAFLADAKRHTVAKVRIVFRGLDNFKKFAAGAARNVGKAAAIRLAKGNPAPDQDDGCYTIELIPAGDA